MINKKPSWDKFHPKVLATTYEFNGWLWLMYVLYFLWFLWIIDINLILVNLFMSLFGFRF